MSDNDKTKQDPPREAAQADVNETPGQPPAAKPAVKNYKNHNGNGKKQFPVVGIGASAGGLEAIEEFFDKMPPDTGLAFIIVQHLEPTHKSILAEIIQRHSKMPVTQVEKTEEIVPDHVYVIPPGRYMSAVEGTLVLGERPTDISIPNMPVNFLFSSMAKNFGPRSVGVILSGTGSDGTSGIKSIKAELGLVVVQSPESAKYAGMPQSGIDTGLADYILPPGKMPERIFSYLKVAEQKKGSHAPVSALPAGESLQKILRLLLIQTKHDFSRYRVATVRRRVERRMTLNQIDNIGDYALFLEKSPVEANALFRDITISVTSFFRDPAAWDALKKIMLDYLERRKEVGIVRVWVPACATGEEAYTIAIILKECADEIRNNFNIQVFATDIDASAVDQARAGAYPSGIEADITPARLRQYFSLRDNVYRVRPDIRKMTVFAVQDIIKDPPFSHLDLLCCRNFLIYLERDLQQEVLSLFHHSLNPEGILFLGTSESIGESTGLFIPVDNKWKIYRSKRTLNEKEGFPGFVLTPLSRQNGAQTNASASREEGGILPVGEIAQRAFMDAFAPAVIVDERYRIVFNHGPTHYYLKLPDGQTDLNVLEMAPSDLRTELSAAIYRASTTGKTVVHNDVKIPGNSDSRIVDLTVKPITSDRAAQKLYLVIFNDVTDHEKEAEAIPVSPQDRKNMAVRRLEDDLKSTKERLQTTIEELQTSNEELKSANEELQSTVEELQSTNEELETSREELRSTNEELLTVNADYREKLEEVTVTNNDMINFLNSTDIATIFVDPKMSIRRYTPTATRIFNLIPGDVGRPVSHITSNLVSDSIVKEAQKVIETLIPQEGEVQTKEGVWYNFRILPYRTTENVIAGLVITFTNIQSQKEANEKLTRLNDALKASLDFSRSVIETIEQPIIVLDKDLRVISVNHNFYETFKVTPKETEGNLIYKLGNGQWNIPELKKLLEEILPENGVIMGFRVEHEFPGIGRRKISLNARRIAGSDGTTERILLTMDDVTGK